MTTSRRRLLQYSLSAASLLALAPGALAAPRPTKKGPTQKKRILVLGGTGFLGPAVVTAAQARGHQLTLFNRGKTRPDLFPGVEKLRGDRDPNKEEGLKALEGRRWDAVIDNSGYYPRMVGASARLLAPNVKQYVFISSVSAYASDARPHEDESAPTKTLADPTVETMGPNAENYGGLKRLCEQEVEKALPRGATIVRPGFIVGPEDRSDRFTWFPVRYDRGGEMLGPGSAADPLQIIDVRDLAEWLVNLVEQGTTGAFNAVGPDVPWTMGELFAACREATGKQTKLTWVPSDFLEKHGENGDGSIPIWVPSTGKTAGFHLRSNTKAVKAGLRFRSPTQTVKDTLTWFNSQPEERRATMRAGLTPEREAELLKLWAEAQAKPAIDGKAG
jgi:2'-hydroxyisoflavone reductase